MGDDAARFKKCFFLTSLSNTRENATRKKTNT